MPSGYTYWHKIRNLKFEIQLNIRFLLIKYDLSHGQAVTPIDFSSWSSGFDSRFCPGKFLRMKDSHGNYILDISVLVFTTGINLIFCTSEPCSEVKNPWRLDWFCGRHPGAAVSSAVASEGACHICRRNVRNFLPENTAHHPERYLLGRLVEVRLN